MSAEWAHATVAWAHGLLPSPFDVTYGDWFLFRVADKGDLVYPKLLNTGQAQLVGVIAIAGPTVNGVLGALGLVVLRFRRLSQYPILSFSMFWFALNNIGQVYSYLPIRGFSSSGDIAIFDRAFGVPHVVLFTVAGAGICGALIIAFVRDLPRCIAAFRLSRGDARRLVRLSAGLIFFWYGAAAAFNYGLHDIRSISFPLSILVGLAVIRWRVGALKEA